MFYSLVPSWPDGGLQGKKRILNDQETGLLSNRHFVFSRSQMSISQDNLKQHMTDHLNEIPRRAAE